MATETSAKWEGKVTAVIGSATAEQIWPFFADFCNLHAWHPQLETCQQAGGTPGEPGLIRYCAGKSVAAEDGGMAWSREMLVGIDLEERWLSYEVVENNIGFGSYVARQSVVDRDDGGCEIEWGFAADPVKGWSLDDLMAYLESALRFMAEKMENVIKSGTAA